MALLLITLLITLNCECTLRGNGLLVAVKQRNVCVSLCVGIILIGLSLSTVQKRNPRLDIDVSVSVGVPMALSGKQIFKKYLFLIFSSF